MACSGVNLVLIIAGMLIGDFIALYQASRDICWCHSNSARQQRAHAARFHSLLRRLSIVTSIPPELYALANAFLFAFHNMLAKKGLRYSNPATAVISSLMINIIFLWAVALLIVPLSSINNSSILIFVLVGFFQPGLTRLLTYKGIDALGVAVTDPIRATTPVFSAAMAIIFLGEK